MNIPNDIKLLKDLVEVLLNRIDQLEQSHAVLESENMSLKYENAELRNRLNQNSNNSNKPPSSDGLAKKTTHPAIAKEKGKKSGGQKDHNGRTLKMVSEPDAVIVHHAPFCSCCSKVFSASDVEKVIHRRQVFDIPKPRLEVTEHQLGLITCCGKKQSGAFPEGVNSLVQYGTKIKSLSVLLSVDHKLPFDKIEQLFRDLYNCSFNESTAISANNAFFEALEPIEDTIKSKILASEVVHFDETGMRVEGKLHWFHTACTAAFTYLFVHSKRGKVALNSLESLIKDFKNWAIHDCWASYFDFKDCYHALCNAHIVRELDNLIELNSQWAIEMRDLLFELYKLSEKGAIIVPNKELWIEKYKNICQKADLEEPKPLKTSEKARGIPKSTKGRNLLNRLTKHQEGILAFAFIDVIPFTNNQAERDIRCIKIKQKVATSFKTFKGAQNYARIQGFLSSVRKHKTNLFLQINNVFDKKNTIFVAD
jgi:transposase